MEKSIAIIGGGIAGLSAGCYGRMNDYRTTIFEMQSKPGGLCTSWKRKGYTVDGCIHWLFGTSPDSDMYRIWAELGAVQGRKMVHHDCAARIERPDGKALTLHAGVDELERHMLELAPEDARTIRRLTKNIRKFTRFEMDMDKAWERLGLSDGLKLLVKWLPFLGPFLKYRNRTIKDLTAGLKNEFLRQVFETVFDPPDVPLLGVFTYFAWMHRRCTGYPVGGSLEFARAIEKRYTDLGGEIRYGSKVERIVVEEGRALGVRLDDGSEHRADYVVSAADGRTTIFDMLEGKYVDETIRGYYKDMPVTSPIIHIALGVARDLSDEPHTLLLILDPPVTIAGKERRLLQVMHYCFDPTLTPDGKSLVRVIMDSNHAYWKDLAGSRERYEAEKSAVATRVIGLLEGRFPGLPEQIEMTDVATPLTFERYTGNWQGSYMGWRLQTKTMMLKMKKTLPGLSGFHMVGQWVMQGGGMPLAAASGRHVIRTICNGDGKRFTASAP